MILKCSNWACQREAKWAEDITIPETDEQERRLIASRVLRCGICKGGEMRQKWVTSRNYVPLASRADIRLLAEAMAADKAEEARAVREERDAASKAKQDDDWNKAWDAVNHRPFLIIPQESKKYRGDAVLSLAVQELDADMGMSWGPGIEVKFRTDYADRKYPAYVNVRNTSEMSPAEARMVAAAINMAADYADKLDKDAEQHPYVEETE